MFLIFPISNFMGIKKLHCNAVILGQTVEFLQFYVC
jgi:hypothetical protein